MAAIVEIAFALVLIVWLAVSVIVLLRLGVLTRGPLLRAPVRAAAPVTLGVGLILVVALYIMFVAAGGAALLRGVDPKTPGGAASFLVTDALAKILASVGIVALAATAFRGGLGAFGLSLRKLPEGVAKGAGAALLLAPLLLLVQIGSGLISQWVRTGPPPTHPVLEMFTHGPSVGVRVVLVLTACVVAPMVEEMLFRGLFQSFVANLGTFPVSSADTTRAVVAEGTGPAAVSRGAEGVLSYYAATPVAESVTRPRARWLAIAVVSFFFVAIHFDPSTVNVEHFPVLAVLAVSLGYLYERTGNLWASMTLHALFNTMNTTLFLTAM